MSYVKYNWFIIGFHYCLCEMEHNEQSNKERSYNWNPNKFCCMYICLMSYRISLMLRFQYEQIFSSIVLSSIIAKLMFLLFCYGTRIHLSHHYLSQSNVYSTEFVPFNLHCLLNITSYIKFCADFNEHTLFSRIFKRLSVFIFCLVYCYQYLIISRRLLFKI